MAQETTLQLETPLVGTRESPYCRPPARHAADGIPWGAWCRCVRCDYVGRTTNAFDFYRDDEAATGGLVCDACLTGTPYGTDALMCRAIDSGEFKCDALGPGCRGGYDEQLGVPVRAAGGGS